MVHCVYIWKVCATTSLLQPGARLEGSFSIWHSPGSCIVREAGVSRWGPKPCHPVSNQALWIVLLAIASAVWKTLVIRPGYNQFHIVQTSGISGYSFLPHVSRYHNCSTPLSTLALGKSAWGTAVCDFCQALSSKLLTQSICFLQQLDLKTKTSTFLQASLTRNKDFIFLLLFFCHNVSWCYGLWPQGTLLAHRWTSTGSDSAWPSTSVFNMILKVSSHLFWNYF